jgi:hypothetical protein
MDSPSHPPSVWPGNDTSDSLREQAASCRRLAGAARTRSGRSSMIALADHFDGLAVKLDAARSTS